MRRKILILVLIPPVLFLFLTIYNSFQVKKVIVISENLDIRGLENLNKKNIITLDNDLIKNEILKKNKIIKSLIITKKFPDTVVLEVVTRQPEYLIVNGSETIPIDKEGIVLYDSIYDGSLAKIYVTDGTFRLGEKTDSRIIKALNFSQSFSEYDIFTEKTVIDNSNSLYELYISGKTQIILPFDSDPYLSAASLQVIITRFRIEGKFIRKVDFRFEKPVVTLANEEDLSSD